MAINDEQVKEWVIFLNADAKRRIEDLAELTDKFANRIEQELVAVERLESSDLVTAGNILADLVSRILREGPRSEDERLASTRLMQIRDKLGEEARITNV